MLIFINLWIGHTLCAIGLLITMLIATFIVHSTYPFAKQELPLRYDAITYLVIVIANARKFSVANWLHSIVNRQAIN